MNTKEQRLQAFFRGLAFHPPGDNWEGAEIRFHDPSALPTEVYARRLYLPGDWTARLVWAVRDCNVTMQERTSTVYRAGSVCGEVQRLMIHVTGNRPVIAISYYQCRFLVPEHCHVGPYGTYRGWDIFADREELGMAIGDVEFTTEPLVPYRQ